MPVDRKIYKVPFSKENPPQWPCPTCGRGALHGESGSFLYSEIKESRDAYEHDGWDPEWIVYQYSCQFKCTNPSCGESVANLGTGSVYPDIEFNDLTREPEDVTYKDQFEPKYFFPNLKIFRVPDSVPRDVKLEIQESFKLFFANPSSSSSHLRIALELILDNLKIKRYEVRKGRRILLSLYKRISLIPDSKSDLRESFSAIRFLGNAGSHSRTITVDDVMDAYDIFEIILEELYEKKLKRAKRLIKKINKKKGPKDKLKR